jgi:hypothetical protein
MAINFPSLVHFLQQFTVQASQVVELMTAGGYRFNAVEVSAQ